MRCFGTVLPFFVHDFWEYYRESLLLRELVDGKVRFWDYILIEIFTLFLPWVEFETGWVEISDDEWEDSSDEEGEGSSDDDW